MIYYIDLFCGAGGVSTGIVRAGAKVLMCINHDPIAITSHLANHPEVIHAVEDITTFDLTPLIELIHTTRLIDPEAIICLWASLECTHFSKAKGGGHREADSRTLAEHLYRYIEAINPDYIDIENVTEFMSWGPLRVACLKSYSDRSDLKVRNSEDGSIDYHFIPFSKKNGKYYARWIKRITLFYGYEYDYRILNSADFGAFTARERYFGQFKKPELPFTWPKPTHSKNPDNGQLFEVMKRWKPVREVLDLQDLGKSIFNRKKDLSENTLKRLYAGLVKYVKKAEDDGFILKYYGNGDNLTSYNSPAATLTTKDRMALTNVVWLDKQYRSDLNHQPVSRPAGTLTTNDKHVLVQAEFNQNDYFIMNPQYSSKGNDLDRPCFTLIARMDKSPPILVDARKGLGTINIYEDESSIVKEIKQFMADNSIVDVKMRMLKVSELLKIQGFGDKYILKGTQTDQKRFIGNSVEVNLAKNKVQSRIKSMEMIKKKHRANAIQN